MKNNPEMEPMKYTRTARAERIGERPQLETMIGRGLALLVASACFVIVAVSAFAIPGFTQFQDLNTIFNVPLWHSNSLWTDNERDVGKRLGWPEESRTTTLASYRLYAK